MPELRREPDFSARALASGLAVGGLLCVANLYMGLKTGIWDSGHVTASVLAFALASGRLTRLENNIAQTAATAAGAVPAAAGLLGAVPALEMLGRIVPGWGIALWGLALAVIGILFGAALRQRLLEEEKLPFPTGVATAEVIEALQAGRAAASGRTRPLMWGGVVGAVLGWFRDGKPALIPGAVAIPGTVGGVPLATLGIGVSLSPLLWGVGMVVGLRIALSMLLGSVLGWGVLAPWLVSGPLHVAANRGAIWNWLSWPGTALLVGAALVALVQQAGAFAGALRDLRSAAGDRSRWRIQRAVLCAAGPRLHPGFPTPARADRHPVEGDGRSRRPGTFRASARRASRGRGRRSDRRHSRRARLGPLAALGDGDGHRHPRPRRLLDGLCPRRAPRPGGPGAARARPGRRRRPHRRRLP